MRKIPVGVWAAAFLLGGAATGFCQVVDIPNGSGRSISVDTQSGTYRETVHTTGDFAFTLLVFRNTQLKFCASATVLTCGPQVSVTAAVRFQGMGLVAGDQLTFILQVRKLSGCDLGKTSLQIAVIPVVARCAGDPGRDTSTYVPGRGGSSEFASEPRAARREEIEA